MGAGAVVVALVCWLTALTVYDIRVRRLPNHLTVTGAAVILAAAACTGRGVPAIVGAGVLFGVYLTVHLVSPVAMGAGDVKLAAGLGALTGSFGADVWLLAALTAPLLTAMWAVVMLVRRAGSTVPHGPSMCVASAFALALAVG